MTPPVAAAASFFPPRACAPALVIPPTKGQSKTLTIGCGGGCGVIPSSCAAALAPSPEIPPAKGRLNTITNELLVFTVVGSIGALSGICTVIHCLWTGVCFGKKKVHNSVQPTITQGGSTSLNSNRNSRSRIFSRSSKIRRQGSRVMGQQRSGMSSKHADHRVEEFSLSELVEATDGFALENKIGSSSFKVVYRGKLREGHEASTAVVLREGRGKKKKKGTCHISKK